MLSDIEIARSAELRLITDVAKDLGIQGDAIIPYGRHKAKLSLELLERIARRPQGKLVLVTGITPTPAGEGKSTVTVGLGDGLRRLGKQPVICLREPSLGPCFGIKGGAAGGGFSQVVPMEDINLHFTGDIHAVSAAHNLLAAMLDNHLHHGNALDIDVRRIGWRRVMDMNDRALRRIVVGMGGPAHGIPRESGFDIAVASEVMAVLCLVQSLQELRERLAAIVVGETCGKRTLVRAGDLHAQGAMTVLLRDALAPNLVQTLEGTPAFVHGGPFANIAHGCNSLLATRMALGLGDYAVTEAGFGADLGAEKFFDIKCRKSGLTPAAAVLVVTARALKMHGGVGAEHLREENATAVGHGCANLEQHLENLHLFGVPVVVAYNRFTGDTDAEIDMVRQRCARWGVGMAVCEGWAKGGEGMLELARLLVQTIEATPAAFRLLYEDRQPLLDKITAVATQIYRADGIEASPTVRRELRRLEDLGFGELPVCMAKTQNSFTAEPELKGAPRGFTIPVREIRLAAGAGFVVVLTGDIMTMPGLPRQPSAEWIDIDERGQVVGLF